MSIIVPQYNKRVVMQAPQTAHTATSGPQAAAFENKSAQVIAQSVKEMGQAVGESVQRAQARAAQREAAKRLADAQLGFAKENNEFLHGKLDDNGNAVSEGLLQRQLANASTVAKDYFERGGELVNKYAALAKTPEEEDYIRKTLSRSFLDNYDRAVRHQLAEERKSANASAEAFFESSAGLAGDITSPQDMRAHLDGVYKLSDENAKGNGKTEEEIKLARYVQANKNMTAAVQGAVFNGNLFAARGLLDNLKSDMLPDDWNRLNWYVLRAEEASQKDAQHKTGRAPGDELLYQRAIELMAQKPQDLQNEIKRAQNNMYAFQQRLAQEGVSVDAKELKTYLEWAQKTLDDPDGPVGAQKRANFAAEKTRYDAFEIGGEEENYKVFNNDLASPAAMAQAATALRARITDGAFTREDAKTAQTYLDNLRRALGTRIKEKPDNSWFSTSGDEFLQNGISKLAAAPDADALDLEDLAGMYEDALTLAEERNLDIQASYKDGQAHFDKLLTDVRTRYAAAKYGVPVGVADAAIYNNRLLALTSGQSVQKPEGALVLDKAVKDYQAGNWNGKRLRVKKAGNEIVDMYYED